MIVKIDVDGPKTVMHDASSTLLDVRTVFQLVSPTHLLKLFRFAREKSRDTVFYRRWTAN